MSCNPAIGGLAKGHIVREIDAMGGAMGLNTDATAIQFRMLNASKGPSVRAPRAQCDKTAYRTRMKMVLETAPGIRLFQGDVVKLLVNGEQQATGAVTSLGCASEYPTGRSRSSIVPRSSTAFAPSLAALIASPICIGPSWKGTPRRWRGSWRKSC